jgi:thiol-disulfide isomerase/thioredoxin
VRYRAKKSTGKTDLTSIELHDAGKQLLKGKIYERFLTDLTMRTMQYGNANEAEELYASANQEITDHDLVLSLTELHRKMMTLNPGNPAPAFTLKDPENKPVSLSDFKGKVVYIDFWASWCGPCRMEMPAARVLQDSFAGKEVVFLYVDIDEDRNEWLKAMKKEQLKGTHVFSQGFEGQMAKLYQINGIPHYFIIGRDGRILDRNAARPSSRDVFKVLNEALAK